MAYSSLWLSQIQFFASVGFMALFLSISLGLSWLLAYFRVRSLWANGAGWLAAYRFWVRAFALALVLSMASGVVVLIQAGSLWPALFAKAGDVLGPLLAAAMICAFIFKSCFLGAMLFAERRLSDQAHALVVLMVALGLTLVLFCLLALISWMQTPAGVWVFDGKYGVRNWTDVIFNPSFLWYAGLYLASSLACAAALVLSVSAWHALWQPAGEGERHAFRTATVLGGASLVVLACLSVGAGQMTAKLLPAKAAATAAYWQSGSQPGLVLFALPSEAQGTNRAVLQWSHAGGRWLGKDESGGLRGLDQFSGMMPPVAATFFSFRLAVAAGGLMALCLLATFWRVRGVWDPSVLPRWWKHCVISMGALGSLLMLGGTVHTLVGGYPYVITGAVTLQEITSELVSWQLLLGLAASLVLYGLCIVAFISLLGHAARYGVVPVARHRGRA